MKISQKQQMLFGACARQTTGTRENVRWGCRALLRITRWPLKVALCHNTLVPTTPAAVKCHRPLPSAGQPAAACRRRTNPPPPHPPAPPIQSTTLQQISLHSQVTIGRIESARVALPRQIQMYSRDLKITVTAAEMQPHSVTNFCIKPPQIAAP